VDWYSEARRFIDPNIALLRPMRGKEFLKNKAILEKYEMPGNPMTTANAISGRDRYDTMRADAILMNLTEAHEFVTVGCMIEAGWADAARRPIVLVAPLGNIHGGHVILEALATYRVKNLEDGCECINELFRDDHYNEPETFEELSARNPIFNAYSYPSLLL
jgi:nucleoside 2-deoxyribosyltransferase